MRIAVNTRFLLAGQLEGYGHFINEIFSRLAAAHPQHEFLYIFDRPFDAAFITLPNIMPVVIGPPARHPLLWKYWYDYRLSAAAKKNGADVLVCPDGFCSLRTRIPQVTVIHDLAYWNQPKAIAASHLRFYKRYTPKFIKKTSVLATVSAFSRTDIASRYAFNEDKIALIPNAVRECFRPLHWQDREAVKTEYAGGYEYFVYAGSIHPRKNLVNLLKAFSIFKKWQRSDMKLLLCGRLAWQHEDFEKSLATYKYRDDVVLMGYQPEATLARVLAGAYALVYPSFFEGFGMPVLEAMKCAVPVVTANTSALPETGGDAALYADPTDPESIAGEMMRLYKDESLRNRLIEKGLQRAQQFSWQQSAEQMWCYIEKAAGK
jgi:glycosyltransferase involved in cell wall biosynthesis